MTQMWKVTGKNGKDQLVEYPVAYVLKQTSQIEEGYPHFLLEFAALRFALLKFDRMIFRQPIEIVTDCQALSDFLNNDSLSAAHA